MASAIKGILTTSCTACFIALIAVVVTAPLSQDFCPTRTHRPNCSCTVIDSYTHQIHCPVFTVRFTRGQLLDSVIIRCANNDASDGLSALDATHIGAWFRSLTIEDCPLHSLSLRKLVQNMGLSGVTNVKIVETAARGHDTVTRVTRELFRGVSNVTSLSFDAGGTIQFSDDIFIDMPNIDSLSLKFYNIVLPKTAFSSATKLRTLHLNSKSLTYLQPGIFRNLTGLEQLLELTGNIRNLSRSVFSDVHRLQTLKVTLSKMSDLPSDVFMDLIKLKNVLLFSNEFLSLPQNLFSNNTALNIINLQDNRRTLSTLPSGFLSNLTQLSQVVITDCKVHILPEDLMWGSQSIEWISLKKNNLTSVPAMLFRDCTKLVVLDMSFNRIAELPNGLLSNTPSLKTIILNNNLLTDIEE